MIECLIYGLYCPFTDDLHYVGKSTIGMVRPNQHMTNSHSDKINEWVYQLKFLGYKPIIKIIEECTIENIDDREIYWINYYKSTGSYLLNVSNNNISNILIKKEYKCYDTTIKEIGNEIKLNREKNGLSQTALCNLAGIDRKTLYRLESGDSNIVIKNVLRVLVVLGLNLTLKK